MFTWKPKVKRIEIEQREFYDTCVTCTEPYNWVGHKYIQWLWFTFKFKFKEGIDFEVTHDNITLNKQINSEFECVVKYIAKKDEYPWLSLNVTDDLKEAIRKAYS